MTKNKFILYGYGTYNNKGCEAIIRGTAEIIQTYFENPVFYTQSVFHDNETFEKQNAQETDPRIRHIKCAMQRKRKLYEKLNVRTILNRLSSEFKLYGHFENFERKKETNANILEHIPECKAALAVGGDNYSLDYGVPKFYTDADEVILSYNKPCILWGASVGPFTKDKRVEKFMSQHLKKVTAIFAREDRTVEYLETIGVKDNVYRVSDPAFLLKPVKPFDIDTLPNLKGAVGINISPLMANYWTQGNLNEWAEYSAKLISKIRNTLDKPIYLIPHVLEKNNNDYEFLKGIAEGDGIYLLNPDYTAAETKYIISQLDCFIGARTHSTIAAFSTLVPTISLAYSIKADGINKEVYGHTKYCINRDSANIDDIAELAKDLVKNRHSIQQEMEPRIEEIQKKALNAGKILKELIT